MKFREFKIRDNITQRDYIKFRTGLEEFKPSAWDKITDLPEELFYHFLVEAAVNANWIQEVVEKNEYEEDVEWSWTNSGMDYVGNLPTSGAVRKQISEWGTLVFEEWIRIRNIDPN